MTAPISKCPRNITFLNFLNSLISIWLISYEDMLASAFMGFCLHYNGQSKVVGPYTVARHGELQNNPLLYHLPTQVAIEIVHHPRVQMLSTFLSHGGDTTMTENLLKVAQLPKCPSQPLSLGSCHLPGQFSYSLLS